MRNFGNIDLVITDLVMPHVDGLELIGDLKLMHPNLPIIAISGGRRIGAGPCLKLARKLGADVVFEKPFIPSELLEKAHALVGANR